MARRVSSTRSTRGRSPTPTATASATSRGITAHLDHLEWLGVDGIWLNPVTVSPDADWGYDVADYTRGAAGPRHAGRPRRRCSPRPRGADIRVLLDLVPNHTSIEHPWFVDARSSRDSAHRDWYVWADPKPDGSVRRTTGSAASAARRGRSTSATGQYYLHNFTARAARPQLVERGRARRVRPASCASGSTAASPASASTSCHMIVKDRELRDNPPATDDDPFDVAGDRPAPGVQREPARGARRAAPVARDRRLVRPAARPRRRDVPARRRADRAVLRRGATSWTSRSTSRCCSRRSTPSALRRVVRETEAALPAGARPVLHRR